MATELSPPAHQDRRDLYGEKSDDPHTVQRYNPLGMEVMLTPTSLLDYELTPRELALVLALMRALHDKSMSPTAWIAIATKELADAMRCSPSVVSHTTGVLHERGLLLKDVESRPQAYCLAPLFDRVARMEEEAILSRSAKMVFRDPLSREMARKRITNATKILAEIEFEQFHRAGSTDLHDELTVRFGNGCALKIATRKYHLWPFLDLLAKIEDVVEAHPQKSVYIRSLA
jgi:hypothetical protein